MSEAVNHLQHRLSVLERKVDFLLKSLNLQYRDPIEPYLKPVVELIEQGQRDAAQLKYMELHSCSAPEAVAAVARLTARLAQD
jgi:hypothetical protein